MVDMARKPAVALDQRQHARRVRLGLLRDGLALFRYPPTAAHLFMQI